MNNKSTTTNTAAVTASLAVVFFATGAILSNAPVVRIVAFIAGLVLIGYAGYAYRVDKTK